jgi:hypothetical protein
VHTSSTRFEISRISKFSGRGEQTLSELPEALGSLSEQLPALSVVVAARQNQLRAHLTLAVLLTEFGKSLAKRWG